MQDLLKPFKPQPREDATKGAHHRAIGEIVLLNAVEVLSMLLDTSGEEFLHQTHTRIPS